MMSPIQCIFTLAYIGVTFRLVSSQGFAAILDAGATGLNGDRNKFSANKGLEGVNIIRNFNRDPNAPQPDVVAPGFSNFLNNGFGNGGFNAGGGMGGLSGGGMSGGFGGNGLGGGMGGAFGGGNMASALSGNLGMGQNSLRETGGPSVNMPGGSDSYGGGQSQSSYSGGDAGGGEGYGGGGPNAGYGGYPGRGGFSGYWEPGVRPVPLALQGWGLFIPRPPVEITTPAKPVVTAAPTAAPATTARPVTAAPATTARPVTAAPTPAPVAYGPYGSYGSYPNQYYTTAPTTRTTTTTTRPPTTTTTTTQAPYVIYVPYGNSYYTTPPTTPPTTEPTTLTPATTTTTTQVPYIMYVPYDYSYYTTPPTTRTTTTTTRPPTTTTYGYGYPQAPMPQNYAQQYIASNNNPGNKNANKNLPAFFSTPDKKILVLQTSGGPDDENAFRVGNAEFSLDVAVQPPLSCVPKPSPGQSAGAKGICVDEGLLQMTCPNMIVAESDDCVSQRSTWCCFVDSVR